MSSADDWKLGIAQQKLFYRDGVGAQDLFSSLAEKYPRDARVWVGLGVAKTIVGDYPSALSAYRTAKTLAPRSPNPYVLSAVALHDMGLSGPAREECRVAREIGLDDPNLRATIERIERETSTQRS